MAQTKLNLRTSIKTSAVVWVIGLGTASLFAAAVIKNQKATPSLDRITIGNSSLAPAAGTTFKAGDTDQTLFAFKMSTASTKYSIEISKLKIIATTQNGKAKQSISLIKNLALYLRDSNGEESQITSDPNTSLLSVGKTTDNSYEIIITKPQTNIDNSGSVALFLGVSSYVGKDISIVLKGDFPNDSQEEGGIISDQVTFSIASNGVTTKSKKIIPVSGSAQSPLLTLDGGINDRSTCDKYNDDDSYCPAGYDCTPKIAALKSSSETTSKLAQGVVTIDGETTLMVPTNESLSIVFDAIDPSQSDESKHFYKIKLASSDGKLGKEKNCAKTTGKLELNPSCTAEVCKKGPNIGCADGCWRNVYVHVDSCSLTSSISFKKPGVYTITGQAIMTQKTSEPDDNDDFSTIKLSSAQVEIYSDPPTGKLTASSAEIANGSPLTLTATLTDDFGFRNDKIIPQYKSDSFSGTLDCGWKNIPGFTTQSCKSGKTACILTWKDNATLGGPGTYTIRIPFGDTDNTPNYETTETTLTVK